MTGTDGLPSIDGPGLAEDYDVAIVGASLAGCAAATLLGRAGRRVAVLESHTDPCAYKRICTTVILPSTVPTLQRLGLDQEIEAAGGVRIGAQLWTRWGWIRSKPPEQEEEAFHGYDIRREKLDPMVRRLAASTPGVELLLGHNVREVLRSPSGRVVGVRAERQDGSLRDVTARLVVAADGRNSSVAKSAGVRAWTVRRHDRAVYFAFYRNVSLPGPGNAHLWFLEPDVAYAFPHDDNLFILACMFTKDKLPAFKRDIESNFVRFLQAVPEFARFDPADRVSRVFGLTDHPNTWRRRPPPGLAFIGDAAVSADYLWGVGCGWAFRSAEWLADAARDSFTSDREIDAAVRRYRRTLRKELAGHFLLISDYSTGRPFNPIEKLMFSAAARDERLAGHVARFGARAMPVRKFLAPTAIARAVRVHVRPPPRAAEGNMQERPPDAGATHPGSTTGHRPFAATRRGERT
ncbi:MAG: NAD(P)/FAD-dependent oxidoreductase [Actinomycetota bacterium]